MHGNRYCSCLMPQTEKEKVPAESEKAQKTTIYMHKGLGNEVKLSQPDLSSADLSHSTGPA